MLVCLSAVAAQPVCKPGGWLGRQLARNVDLLDVGSSGVAFVHIKIASSVLFEVCKGAIPTPFATAQTVCATHGYLLLQRALDPVPAGGQIPQMVNIQMGARQFYSGRHRSLMGAPWEQTTPMGITPDNTKGATTQVYNNPGIRKRCLWQAALYASDERCR